MGVLYFIWQPCFFVRLWLGWATGRILGRSGGWERSSSCSVAHGWVLLIFWLVSLVWSRGGAWNFSPFSRILLQPPQLPEGITCLALQWRALISRITSATRSETTRTDMVCSLSWWGFHSCFWVCTWPWPPPVYTRCPVLTACPTSSSSTRPEIADLQRLLIQLWQVGKASSLEPISSSHQDLRNKSRSGILLSVLP